MLRFLFGLVVGFGTAVVVSGQERSRPLAKRVLKSGIKAFRGGREVAARIGETVDDLMAEARSEMESDEAVEAEHESADVAPKPNSGPRQVNEATPKEEATHAADGKD